MRDVIAYLQFFFLGGCLVADIVSFSSGNVYRRGSSVMIMPPRFMDGEHDATRTTSLLH